MMKTAMILATLMLVGLLQISVAIPTGPLSDRLTGGASKNTTTEVGKCQEYVLGGTSRVHFFTCCNGGPKCDNEVEYDGASDGDYCKNGTNSATGGGKAFRDAFECKNCTTMGECKSWCDKNAITFPGACWNWTWCFRDCCKDGDPSDGVKGWIPMPRSRWNEEDRKCEEMPQGQMPESRSYCIEPCPFEEGLDEDFIPEFFPEWNPDGDFKPDGSEDGKGDDLLLPDWKKDDFTGVQNFSVIDDRNVSLIDDGALKLLGWTQETGDGNSFFSAFEITIDGSTIKVTALKGGLKPLVDFNNTVYDQNGVYQAGSLRVELIHILGQQPVVKIAGGAYHLQIKLQFDGGVHHLSYNLNQDRPLLKKQGFVGITLPTRAEAMEEEIDNDAHQNQAAAKNSQGERRSRHRSRTVPNAEGNGGGGGSADE